MFHPPFKLKNYSVEILGDTGVGFTGTLLVNVWAVGKTRGTTDSRVSDSYFRIKKRRGFSDVEILLNL